MNDGSPTPAGTRHHLREMPKAAGRHHEEKLGIKGLASAHMSISLHMHRDWKKTSRATKEKRKKVG